jgi:HEAT repeat protein
VRAEAAYALGAIGPDARAALPALRELQKDGDEDVREAAAAAVKQIETKGP